MYLVRAAGHVTPHEETSAPLAVAIICEVKFIAESLVDSLSRDERLRAHGPFGNWREALSAPLSNSLHMVLIDGALEGGLATVKQLRGEAPNLLVVVFGLTDTYEAVIAWAEAGIAGYVPRHATLSDLPSLLFRITQGEQSCSPSVASGLLRSVCRSPKLPEPSPELTSREAQIIELLAAGLTNKEIARRLNIGLPTAKTHVHHVLGKLHLQRRGQAAEWMRQRYKASRPFSD